MEDQVWLFISSELEVAPYRLKDGLFGIRFAGKEIWLRRPEAISLLQTVLQFLLSRD